jgi:hypothetical protein
MFCTFSNGNLSKVSRFKLKSVNQSVNQISDPYVIIGGITELYKLHFLSNILRIFKLQNYLEFPLSKEHRSFLTKIRINAHSLNIETGRYNSTPREQRLCKLCPSSVLPIDSGTPTDPKRRTPVTMHYVYCLLLLKICKFVLF